jgi:hypothetical protein
MRLRALTRLIPAWKNFATRVGRVLFNPPLRARWRVKANPPYAAAVIASEAKQSILAYLRQHGLLRFARNDEASI